MEKLRDNSSAVIDEMALVQRLEADNMCFGDVSKFIFSKALSEGSSSGSIGIVLDVHRRVSIKNAERLTENH